METQKAIEIETSKFNHFSEGRTMMKICGRSRTVCFYQKNECENGSCSSSNVFSGIDFEIKVPFLTVQSQKDLVENNVEFFNEIFDSFSENWNGSNQAGSFEKIDFDFEFKLEKLGIYDLETIAYYDDVASAVEACNNRYDDLNSLVADLESLHDEVQYNFGNEEFNLYLCDQIIKNKDFDNDARFYILSQEDFSKESLHYEVQYDFEQDDFSKESFFDENLKSFDYVLITKSEGKIFGFNDSEDLKKLVYK